MGDAAGSAALPGRGHSGGPGALHRHGAAVEPAGQREPRVLCHPGCRQLHPPDRPLRAPRPLLSRGAYPALLSNTSALLHGSLLR